MELIGLLHIEKVFIPKEFLESIYEEFRETGLEGYERLALLAGKKAGKEFTVTHLLFPKQELFRTATGVGFYVRGEELERIGDWLYENSCSLIAQLHSHPNEAYHSEADDELCIITSTGGLSIVIPDYGQRDQYLEQSAFYRLLPGQGWAELSATTIQSLIHIID